MLGRHPVDHAFHLTAIGRILAQGIRIVAAEDSGDLAFSVFLHAFRFDHVGITQTHFFPQHQTLVLLVGFFAEVSTVDINLAAERHFTAAHFRLVRVIRHRHHFHAGSHIFNDNLNRIQHRHRTRCVVVQLFTNASFERHHFNVVILLGHADTLAEFADGCGGIATTTQAGNGRHTRVIPAFNDFLGHQLVQLALRHDGVFEIKA
ncbi:hypothetical protein D3C72_1414380 [compost metagenome]